MSTTNSDDELTRRDVMTLLAAGFGVSIGWLSRSEESQMPLLPGGEGSAVSVADGQLWFGTDYETLVDRIDPVDYPALAWTSAGNRYQFGDGQGVIRLDDLTLKFGASGYEDAKSMVQTFPTIVITADGTQYTFTES